MSQSYSPYRSDYRQQSPIIPNNDRYTPLPSERKPEVYYLGMEKENEPIHSESPHRSLTPSKNTFHPSSNGAAEMYHLKIVDDQDQRLSPEFGNQRNRVTSTPPPPSHLKSFDEGPGMYYLQADNDRAETISAIAGNPRQQPHSIDSVMHAEPDAQQKAEVYILTTTDDENRENLRPPSHHQRTPSPPIRPAKKQQPMAYDILDNTTKLDVTPKQRSFPTALGDVTSNIRYTPLTHSKASESIQRSMNKYRFGGH